MQNRRVDEIKRQSSGVERAPASASTRLRRASSARLAAAASAAACVCACVCFCGCFGCCCARRALGSGGRGKAGGRPEGSSTLKLSGLKRVSSLRPFASTCAICACKESPGNEVARELEGVCRLLLPLPPSPPPPFPLPLSAVFDGSSSGVSMCTCVPVSKYL
jgi:hypothetical protein